MDKKISINKIKFHLLKVLGELEKYAFNEGDIKTEDKIRYIHYQITGYYCDIREIEFKNDIEESTSFIASKCRRYFKQLKGE